MSDNIYWRDVYDKAEKRIEALEKSQITKVFYEQWVDKLTDLRENLKVKDIALNSHENEIRELKERNVHYHHRMQTLYDELTERLDAMNIREIIKEEVDSIIKVLRELLAEKYRELLEKLEEKSDSEKFPEMYEALKKLQGETEKKCANCKKYKTEECPPWPTKGPDHWCTQYKKASGGDSAMDVLMKGTEPESETVGMLTKEKPPEPCNKCGGKMIFNRNFKDEDENIIYEFSCSKCNNKDITEFPKIFEPRGLTQTWFFK